MILVLFRGDSMHRVLVTYAFLQVLFHFNHEQWFVLHKCSYAQDEIMMD